jgi:hypothetical protein
VLFILPLSLIFNIPTDHLLSFMPHFKLAMLRRIFSS